MAENAAEVVAVIRGDTKDFEEAMRRSDAALGKTRDKQAQGQKEQETALPKQLAWLKRIEVGWLAVGAAGTGALLGLLSRSTLVNNQLAITDTILGQIGNTVARGLGVDRGLQGFNRDLRQINKELRNPDEAFARYGRDVFDPALIAQARSELHRPPDVAGQIISSLQGAGEILAGLGIGALGFEREGTSLLTSGGADLGKAFNPSAPTPALDNLRRTLEAGGKPAEQVLRIIVESKDQELQEYFERWLDAKRRRSVGGGGFS